MPKALVIGTSYGGLEALKAIVPKLPKTLPAPVLIVLHIGDNKNTSFIQYLNSISKIQIKEAEEKEPILPGIAYFAPPNYHMMVEADGSIALSTDPKVHYSRPSIDVLFESAAWHYKNQLIGLILSGMNQDGAYGLLKIKEYGGISIVQSPDDAIASIMPKAAIDLVQPDYILKLSNIPQKIIEIAAI